MGKKLLIMIFMRLGLGILTILFGMAISSHYSPVRAATGPNLIANPSMEQTDINKPSQLPQSWSHSSWGSNTTNYSYLKTGQNGSRSVKVNTSSYSSGDAKWLSSEISIAGASEYNYSDYYRANINSEIVLQITDEKNNISYMWLGTANKSNSWKKASYRFTTPVGAKKLTVLHLIAGKGWLIIDNTSLAQFTPDTPIVTDGVPNYSFEQIDEQSGNPLAWQNSKWGNNTANFSYLSSGKSGSHSAKIDMTRYTDGDAKWYFNDQPVLGGQAYKISDYYKSNIDTHVVVAVTINDGSISYLNLKNAPASPIDWTQYSDTIELPTGATTATVYHLIAGVGYLIVDDYSFTATTVQGFNRGLVSLTFDDGWKSIHTFGLPILNAHNALSTQYILTGKIDSDVEYMTISDVIDFKNTGHEIASHTVTHPDLTTLAYDDLMSELTNSKIYLENQFGGSVIDLASPYGAYNSTTIGAIKTLYRSHRSVDEGYNTKDNYDLYNIRVQNILSTTTPEQVASWIAKAKADNTWLVLVYHQVDNSSSSYSVTPANLEAHLKAIDQAGLPILTIDQAIAELSPQI